MQYPDVTLSHRLQLLLAASRYQQVELARKAGISHNTLSRLMNDPDVDPRHRVLESIAKALGVPMLALANDTECVRAVANICQVSISSIVGRPHPELDKLLDEVGPEREGAILSMVRGMAQLSAPAPPVRVADPGGGGPPPQQQAPSVQAGGRRRGRR